MTNHLMGGHAFATALTLGAHPCQSVEHFVAVGGVEESFHFGKAILRTFELFCWVGGVERGSGLQADFPQ
jgi:hypothetical protein